MRLSFAFAASREEAGRVDGRRMSVHSVQRTVHSAQCVCVCVCVCVESAITRLLSLSQ